MVDKNLQLQPLTNIARCCYTLHDNSIIYNGKDKVHQAGQVSCVELEQVLEHVTCLNFLEKSFSIIYAIMKILEYYAMCIRRNYKTALLANCWCLCT